MTTEPIDSVATPPAEAAPAKPAKKEDSYPVFLLKLFVIVIVFRSFILSPFNIPSESMLPRLEKGDYLLASKWSYGYSKYSLPLSLPLIPGRLLASQPERGDVAIFKAPPGNDVDYIKRVIGLPGDQIQMIGGVLHINGTAVPKERVANAEYEVAPYNQCNTVFQAKRADGTPVCRYPRFKETLPNGVSYYVLDLGTFAADDTPVFLVPEGNLFMMGDNRDNSEDSRFEAEPGGGIGFVPQENLVGKAQVMMFSTDGSSSWLLPWTWFNAARWDRIGGRI
ncbi:signal peptidase I [Novosphingobium aquae]|uniref:Signal peptidase I n=1 Tax=Novosphingobium aquae TaxID=3133435 RepID=A0ABU8S6Y4_9SPHN